MTWGELKTQIEAAGVTDTDEIIWQSQTVPIGTVMLILQDGNVSVYKKQ